MKKRKNTADKPITPNETFADIKDFEEVAQKALSEWDTPPEVDHAKIIEEYEDALKDSGIDE